MSFDGIEKLIAAVGAAIAAVLTPLGVMYAANINRQTKVTEISLSSLQERCDDLEADLKKVRAEVEEERKQGLRWYKLYLFWYNKCHDVRRHALDARKMAEELADASKSPRPVWSDPLYLSHSETPEMALEGPEK